VELALLIRDQLAAEPSERIIIIIINIIIIAHAPTPGAVSPPAVQ
jgi:hypothetical protein